MSFGAFGAGAAAQSNLNIAMAEQELVSSAEQHWCMTLLFKFTVYLTQEMVTTLFNNIVDSCHKKCIPPRYTEEDLNKGESVCIDRCVSKYFAVNAKIGEKLSGAAQQGQMVR
ncbi:protein transporter tim10 [Rhizophlyctis rosea]|uniref:Mitochondrial import inner membrane translocase subunit n=1 Tax=Rhizophlyctis rosea TaxID=64517 RepID=A0AAD5SBH6_9FUNG|nr:protein transporter tim10 [Rhizophlyctis rosea]